MLGFVEGFVPILIVEDLCLFQGQMGYLSLDLEWSWFSSLHTVDFQLDLTPYCVFHPVCRRVLCNFKYETCINIPLLQYTFYKKTCINKPLMDRPISIRFACRLVVQWNLYIKTTLGASDMSLYTGGHICRFNKIESISWGPVKFGVFK